MNIIRELHKLGITWTIGPVVDKIRPESLSEKLCQQVTVTFPEGEPLVKRFTIDSGEPAVRLLLIQTIRDDERVKDLMRAWFDSRGNVPVRLTPGMIEHGGVSELVHTALRKCASGPARSIVWNALHQLRSEDRIAFWSMVTKLLTDVFEARKGKTPPTRRQVASALKAAVLKHFDEMSYDTFENARGRRVTREPEERFALLAMHCACEATEGDEWVWGWLGYAVQDIDGESGEPVDHPIVSAAEAYETSAIERVYQAVLSTRHTIVAEEITLEYDPKQAGHNALNQLHTRITAAIKAPRERVEVKTSQSSTKNTF